MKLIKNFLPIIVILLILIGAIQYNWTKTYIVTINKTDIKHEGFFSQKKASNSSTYMVYTKLDNNEFRVFEDTDYWLRFKFNSSDIYNQLITGSKYKINVVGWRIPLFSKYENIISVEEIK